MPANGKKSVARIDSKIKNIEKIRNEIDKILVRNNIELQVEITHVNFYTDSFLLKPFLSFIQKRLKTNKVDWNLQLKQN